MSLAAEHRGLEDERPHRNGGPVRFRDRRIDLRVLILPPTWPDDGSPRENTADDLLALVYGVVLAGCNTAEVREANALRDARAGCPCSSLAMAVCLSSKS